MAALLEYVTPGAYVPSSHGRHAAPHVVFMKVPLPHGACVLAPAVCSKAGGGAGYVMLHGRVAQSRVMLQGRVRGRDRKRGVKKSAWSCGCRRVLRAVLAAVLFCLLGCPYYEGNDSLETRVPSLQPGYIQISGI